MATARKVNRVDALTTLGAAGGWGDIAAIVGILGCAFALVALGGWHAGDPTPLAPGTGRVENWCGPVGALIADLLFGAVGHGAWAIAAPAALLGLRLAGRPTVRPLRAVAWIALYIDALAGLHLALRPGVAFPPGGMLGWGVAEGLESVFGPIGAWFGIGGSGLILTTALFRIDWGTHIGVVVDRMEAGLPKAVDVSGRAVRWSGGAGAAAVAFAGKLGWKALRGAGLKVGNGLDNMGGAVRRMGESLVRDDDPYPALARAAATGSGYLDDDGGGEIPVDPTVPRALAVAQVQWDPTPLPDARTKGVLNMFPDLEPRPTKSDPGRAALPPDEHTAESTGAVDREDEDDLDEEDLDEDDEDLDEDDEDLDEEDEDDEDLDEDDEDFDEDEDDDDDEDDEDDEDEDEDLDEDEDDDEDPPADRRPAARTSAPARAAAALSAGTARAENLVVHKNKLLESKTRDDGAALAAAGAFELPPLALLDDVPFQKAQFDEREMRGLAELVEEKLLTFKIGGQTTAIRPGPVVTLLEFVPDPGVKVSKIAGLADDLAMALKAQKVRIVAPIPGRGAVGIEIPSPQRMTIWFREVIASEEFRSNDKHLPMVIGKDAEGRVVVTDLAKMPHLLIGGTTGSGKSVGVNGMILSLLFTRTPEELRLLLVDPKKLEFEMYNDIPHLLHPVITDAAQASAALAWACREMDERYELLARWGVRNIVSYNERVERELADWTVEKARKYAPKGWTEADGPLVLPKKLPFIVIVIDELADLMMVAKGDVETSIARIAQKARACGMHLIIATQRPSVDVVTGLIKANLPTRIAYTLRSEIDSRTILDQVGAKQLLNMGDCLFLPPGSGNLMRAHAAFVKDDEVQRITDFLREQGSPAYAHGITASASDKSAMGGDKDDMFDQAVRVCVQLGKASTSLVQRHLKIGYNRAANIIDQMEAAGVIGPADGAKPREVLITAADLD